MQSSLPSYFKSSKQIRRKKKGKFISRLGRELNLSVRRGNNNITSKTGLSIYHWYHFGFWFLGNIDQIQTEENNFPSQFLSWDLIIAINFELIHDCAK